jgi:bifunctional non-homologous end joining protein LigD
LPKRISAMPGFIKPQLAALKSKAPKGEHWLHEIKFDGYRIQVHLNRGRKKVFTRNGLDWTKRFTEITGALAIPYPVKPSSTARWWSSMKGAPISPNSRQS